MERNKKCIQCNSKRVYKQIIGGHAPHYICEPCFDSIENSVLEKDNLAKRINPTGVLSKNSKIVFEDSSTLLHLATIDMTTESYQNKMQPIVGRKKEIERAVEILSRKNKNNPMLIGEPGVGKTAIAEGIAALIFNRKAPNALNNKKILKLNLAKLTEGTMYRGEFEKKFNELMDLVQEKDDIILFIDEIHSIVGLGDSKEGNSDMSNLLKPYLTNGNLSLIGATTIKEFKVIEKDKALNRRFRSILVKEPSISETKEIVQGILPIYEKFHNVHYPCDVVDTILSLCHQYLPSLNFPDKAIDIIDELGSKAKIDSSLHDDITINDYLDEEMTHFHDQNYRKADETRFKKLNYELDLKNALSPPLEITLDHVHYLMEKISGIPIRTASQFDLTLAKTLSEKLQNRVYGQTEAVSLLAKSVIRQQFSLFNKTKPTVLYFTGPTGVGKTELAKALAIELYGSTKHLITVNMAEYMESHTTSKLIGAPPGYIGHDEQPPILDQLKNNPYSIVLLDEFEKAHSSIGNLFLRAFDEGILTSSEGNTIDLRNMIIIMTSNIGQSNIKPIGITAEDSINSSELIKTQFSPEFLNRIDEVIHFNHLEASSLTKMVKPLLEELASSLSLKGLSLVYTDEAINGIIQRCYHESRGARGFKRNVKKHLEDLLIDHMLSNPNNDISLDELESKQTFAIEAI